METSPIYSKHSIEHPDEKFKLLFEFSPVGMTIIDKNTNSFLEVNRRLLDITGYTKEEFLQLTSNDLTYSPNDFKENETFEKLCIKKDGSPFPVKINGFSMIDNEGKEVICYTVEDITEKRQHDIISKDSKILLEYITLENSLDKILHRIIELWEKRNPQTMCSILLLDETKQYLSTKMAPSLPSFYNDIIKDLPIGEKVGSCGSAAYLKKRVVTEDILSNENWAPYTDILQKTDLRSCWSEPIISSTNEVFGTFGIYSKTPKKPTNFELQLIETYASLVSKAIEKDNYTQYIKESETKLQQLFDNMQSGLVYITDKRVLIKANQTFADILGYDTPEELIGKHISEFHLSKERFEEFGKQNFEPLRTRESHAVQYELKKKDGSAIWCNMSAKVLDDKRPADLSKGVLWTITDISISKQHEKELIENEALLRTMLSTIPDMIWLKDTQGRYLICNEEFEKFFGAKQEEIVGKTDHDFISKELADFFVKNDTAAMNSPVPLKNEEWVTYATDKRKVLLDTTKSALKDKDGNTLGVLGIGHDITQRKLKENELQKLYELAQSLTRSQQVLLSLFDKGESVLFRWMNNSELIVDYVSSSIENLLDNTKEEILKKQNSYYKYIHPNDILNVKEEFQTIIQQELEYFQHDSYRIITSENKEKWVTGYTVSQKDDKGRVTHLIGYITDITKIKQQQEQLFNQTKMASMGEMIGNIAHQWRQPLSVISTGASGLLLQKQYGKLSDEKFTSTCELIEKNAQYLSQTIEDFKNFIKGDNHPKVFKLHSAIESFLKIIDSTIKSNYLKIILDIDDTLEMQGFPNELIQCLMNLFNNSKDALEDIDENERYIFISQRIEQNNIVIEFKDNAGGIPDDVITKIFEPYFTTKHASKGTGLGLHMTYNLIVNGMAGDIKVNNVKFQFDNKNHTGAMFTLSLPINGNIS